MVYETSVISGTLWLGIGVMVIWGAIAFILGSWLYKRKAIVADR
jgi:ABC-2 type transport system permease protein